MKKSLTVALMLFSIISYSQNDNELVVHEWGTFTAKYSDFGIPYANLHETVNEKAPDFVHGIGLDHEVPVGTSHGTKDDQYYTYEDVKIKLLNVFIKMETPVLYFYSDTEINNLGITVDFKNGSINEYYPDPILKETKQFVNGQLVHNELLSFKHYQGFAEWNIDVLAPETKEQCTHLNADVPKVWLEPRKTKANLITSNGETEKYVFYRGLGGFENSIVPRYTSNGDLKVENIGEEISYAIAYERGEDGTRYIWGTSSIGRKDFTVFSKSTDPISDEVWQNYYRPQFVSELEIAGLYKDEAEAMLNTWDESYFGSSGLKVFWIVPKNYVDTILPISFSKEVAELERVMIGRTEIDAYNPMNKSQYVDVKKINAAKPRYTLNPNPIESVAYVTYYGDKIEKKEVVVSNAMGQEVYRTKLTLIPNFKVPLSLVDVPTGNYFISVEGFSQASKVIIK
jgi:hypothetical protein